ncbi:MULTISPECIES: alpha/beta hydrolase family protein [Streptomyces]|uniref:alpha/beta hydrolase family protein n=1 Tax=Streptomyces TaxID=1883 RepID=UPI00017E8EA6|nr:MULTISPECIES: CocE/NonD family hydrolase [Streptomyces]AKL67030.1 hydrolase [Streptomyces sp. Mg1]EDX23267.1 hydrolase protein [Streptomyces sp. Mg1]RPK48339.1 Alpha/beta hydrolase family protein [Streptomyces sp. ADI91-18]WBY21183.1 alpha/beta hydrolase [Streptomyces goshikiensis]WSR99975.1 alpha/beta hydrolase [Streptomyces goshikiensis]
MPRRLRTALLLLLATALVLTGVVLWQNSYDLREQRVTVRAAGHDLGGVLAMPEHGRGPFGLVVFVHGDGPADATHDGFYRPYWEAFARAGYASLSLGKPADWLGQSMDDRARETLDAIAWARTRPEVDGGRIGLWGASQAGWVLPKVAAAAPAPGVRFVIAAGTAVNWLRQGEYNLRAELRAEGAGPERTATALARREATLALLRRGATYEEYRAGPDADRELTPERWAFISRNHTADASADLRAMPRVPVLLLSGADDLNVDGAETESVYRELLAPGTLTVRRYPGTTHALVRTPVERSGWRLPLTALFAPRALFPPGLLDDQRRFLDGAAR